MTTERIIIVGTGVAGLTAALAARSRGMAVTVLTKATIDQSNTRYAQGGIAAATGPDDSVEAHVEDTLRAGAGLSDRFVAETICGEGSRAVAELLAAGVRFDVVEGQLALGLEGAHSRPRVLHANGDATGAAIAEALIERLAASGAVVHEHALVAELLRSGSRVAGVRLLDGTILEADAVVLATGGVGQLYPYTTNPTVATGDGLALALRAGALLADVEFMQFHPTSLAIGGNALISEAVRGEGAVLRGADGRRFMLDVHPDAELAPRDVVARAIAAQMRADGGAAALLDATSLGREQLAQRFPGIDAMVRSRGLDWSREPVPVTPAAHYLMGGVVTDDDGRTTVPGLFAVGEVACTGLHGANRLASNSLLEGAVLGRRAIEALDLPWPDGSRLEHGEPIVLTEPAADSSVAGRHEVQQIMWRHVGLERDGAGLTSAVTRLDQLIMPPPTDVKSAEDSQLLLVARAVAAAALHRIESRGAHWRVDAPETEPLGRHSAVVMEV